MSEIEDSFKGVKEHRKQLEQATPSSQRCYDWMFAKGYSYHYAKDRSWFKEYHPINANVGDSRLLGMGNRRAIGIGTVELEVKRSPEDQSTRILVLKDVLHIPDAISNVVGVTGCKSSYVQGTDAAGQPLWYGVEFCGLSRLVLAEQPKGESELEHMWKGGIQFFLNLYATEEQLSKIKEQLRVNNW
jgi:hypothetical protein